MAPALKNRIHDEREISRVVSKRHIEDIWLADLRLKLLSQLMARAIVTGNFESAEQIKRKCTKIKNEIFVRYAVILDRV